MKKKFNLLVIPSVNNMQQVVDNFSFPVEFTKGSFNKIEFSLENNKASILHDGIDIKEFSFVWLSSSWNSRDLAYAMKLYLDKNKVPCTYVEKGTSKLTDHIVFGLEDIPSPNTIFVDTKNVENNLDEIEKICKYPLLIKDIKGSRGLNSELIFNRKLLLKKVKLFPKDKKYFFQQYIPNEYDWGVMVSNGKVVSGEKSYPCDGEFRNNVCNGAREVFIDIDDIPRNVKKIAVDASKKLGLDWSRSDIVIDKKTKKPYIMEINRLPGITSETSEVGGAYDFLFSQIVHRVKHLDNYQ